MAEETQTMTRHQRYYALHREEKLEKVKERYMNDPEFIAKQQEKERKKAEKGAEKEAKRLEKERIRQERIETIENERKIKQELAKRIRKEKLALAMATKKKTKSESGGLDSILSSDCPASGKK